MGDESIAKYLNVRTVFAAFILVIISLCGTIIVLKEGSISAQIDQKVKVALECAKFASAEALDKVDREKLDLSVYQADQKRIEVRVEEVQRAIEKIDRNVDMLIRLQLQGKKAIDIDRKATKTWREGQDKP
jgi:hypothetical protein